MRWSKLSFGFITLLLLACTGKEGPFDEQKVKSFKVAVVLPEAEKSEFSKIVNWAQETIKSAQRGQGLRLALEAEHRLPRLVRHPMPT